MGLARVAIVVRYRRSNTYGPHVVLGALETLPAGHYPDAVHLATSVEALVAAIREAAAGHDAVLVLWSFYSPDFAAAAAELAAVRQLCDDGRVVHLAGGVHATAEPLATLAAGFDRVAAGDGEGALTGAVTALRRGDDLDGVPGLVRLGEGGRLRRGAAAERADLDAYPPFAARLDRFNPIEITRGCVFACRFCQTPFMFKARFRHRTVGDVRRHVRTMLGRGRRDIRFITPTSLSYGSPDETADLDAVEALLAGVAEEVAGGGRIFFGSFPSELRPEHVSVRALRILKTYVANDNVIIGAQSGSERILAASGRGHGVEAVEAAVRACRQVGFTANVDFIFGMPGETDDDVRDTVRLARRLAATGARIHGHTFMPLPGTPWRNKPPGAISADLLAELDRLASRGELYGGWRNQERVAAELTLIARRDHDRARP